MVSFDLDASGYLASLVKSLNVEICGKHGFTNRVHKQEMHVETCQSMFSKQPRMQAIKHQDSSRGAICQMLVSLRVPFCELYVLCLLL